MRWAAGDGDVAPSSGPVRDEVAAEALVEFADEVFIQRSGMELFALDGFFEARDAFAEERG